MVAASAIAPHQPCRAALIIKEAAIKLMEISRLSSKIRIKKNEARELVGKWKNIYNASWVLNYDKMSEFWTFEYLIDSFKVFFCSNHQSFKTQIVNLNPDKVIHELTAEYHGQSIMKTLGAFSMIIQPGTVPDNILSYILSDPRHISSQVSQISLGDERTLDIIQRELGNDVNHFLEQVEDEYIRLYVDILGLLPPELSFRILFMLDHKSLVRAMQTCKKWYTLINSPVFWKSMSYSNGWGLVFLPKEKAFDWKDFYQQMAVASKVDFSGIKSAYLKDLGGFEGLQYVFCFNLLDSTRSIVISFEKFQNISDSSGMIILR